MPKALSVDLRERVVAAYERNLGTMDYIAKIFMVGVATIHRLISKKRKGKSLASKPHGGGKSPTLSKSDLELLKEMIDQKHDYTLKELAEELSKRINKKLGVSHIARGLKKIGYSWKKKTFYAKERDSDKVQKERKDFEEQKKSLDVNKLVFLDESGYILESSPTYAWGLIGERVEVAKPYRGERVNMIGALGIEGVRTMMTIEGGVGGDVFSAFVEQLLVKTLKPGDIVVMDNLSSHDVDGIQQKIEGVGAKVQFLPRYSPDMNPIEQCWSKLKQFIRKLKPKTRDEFDDAVARGMATVTRSDTMGWFQCAGYVGG